MRTSVLLISGCFILLSLVTCSFQSKPASGEWKGDNISFSIDETGDTIIDLNVVIPYDGEYLTQFYHDLTIKNGKFSSYRNGNTYLGIPEANLEGEFLSDQLAKGTFNKVSWTASPVITED